MAEIQPDWSRLYSNSGIRFQGNAGLDALNQKYSMFQQQRQADAKQYGSLISSMNFGGVKPADMPQLTQQFGDVLKTYSKLRSTTDPNEYAKLSMDLKIQQQKMLYDTSVKREAHAQELKSIETLNHPNNYPAEGSAATWQDVVNTPTGTPEYEKKLQSAHENMFDKPIDTDKLGDSIFKRAIEKRVSTGDYKYNPTLGMYERGKTTATSLDKSVIDKEWSDYLINNPKDAHKLMDKWNTPDIKELAAKLSDNTWESNKGKIHSDTVMEAPHESESQKRENIILSKKYGQMYGQSNQPTPFRKTVDVLKNVYQTEGDAGADKYADVITNSIQREGLQGKITHKINNGVMTIDVPARLEGSTVKQPVHMEFNLKDEDLPSNMQEQLDKAGLKMTQYNQAYKGTDIPHNKPTHGKMTPHDFNTKWSALKKGEKLVGPDGKTYIKQ